MACVISGETSIVISGCSCFISMTYRGHFKSRNEEIRNGNEEMGNEKK